MAQRPYDTGNSTALQRYQHSGEVDLVDSHCAEYLGVEIADPQRYAFFFVPQPSKYAKTTLVVNTAIHKDSTGPQPPKYKKPRSWSLRLYTRKTTAKAKHHRHANTSDAPYRVKSFADPAPTPSIPEFPISWRQRILSWNCCSVMWSPGILLWRELPFILKHWATR